ncbi:hypothetical protein OUZ56_031280 [Daphnia magna]|uniref:Uncharacterized protein n=1 Tax=Daphnia magna TaxID=35525 RepID=A0ABQ9ZUY2_9CRUS|nr:hypothetical protein OUZ56_031280 [Daphnia magna]
MPTKSIYTQLGGCEGCVDIAVNTAEQEHETTACTVLGRPCCQYDRSSCQNCIRNIPIDEYLFHISYKNKNYFILIYVFFFLNVDL